MSKKYFKETVEVKGKSFWIVTILAVALIFLIGFVDKSGKFEGFFSLSLLATVLFSTGIMIFLIVRTKLSIKVTSKNINVKLSPFYRSKIKIRHSEVVSYRLEETDPFAIRLSKNPNSWFEKKLTLTGRNGISLTTVSGNSFFIGSANPQALNKAMKKIFPE